MATKTNKTKGVNAAAWFYGKSFVFDPYAMSTWAGHLSAAQQAVQPRPEPALCAYPGCAEMAETWCNQCDSNFCSDHGTAGGDRPVQDVGLVAHPAACYRCGGFNADEY